MENKLGTEFNMNSFKQQLSRPLQGIIYAFENGRDLDNCPIMNNQHLTLAMGAIEDALLNEGIPYSQMREFMDTYMRQIKKDIERTLNFKGAINKMEA